MLSSPFWSSPGARLCGGPSKCISFEIQSLGLSEGHGTLKIFPKGQHSIKARRGKTERKGRKQKPASFYLACSLSAAEGGRE